MKTNYRAANSIHEVFCQMPASTIQRLSRKIARLTPSSGLTYTDEKGKTTPITITLRPRLLQGWQKKEILRIVQILDRAFLKIAGLYTRVPRVAELFPFEPTELDWISMLEEPGYVPGLIVSRWDANTTFNEETWRHGFSFFETNGVGVGGVWYCTVCCEILLKTVVPQIQKIDPRFRPVLVADIRRLLLEALQAQRKKIKRVKNSLALMMEKASGSNYVEFERLAAIYRAWGFPAVVIEPVELELRKNEIFARGKKIDLVYRDTTLEELCGFEEKGHDLGPLKEAFRRGQVVSSLEGEFDHKSAFEVFSHPDFERYFTKAEIKIFKRHILWTRLVRETKTPDFRGRPVDLVSFILKNQSDLVLKPNRLYGGQGIVFGNRLSRKTWHKKIAHALERPGQWVVQKSGDLRSNFFYRPGKRAEAGDFYVVSGFLGFDKGLGIVGRMSERAVVNVAQRGGLTPVLLMP